MLNRRLATVSVMIWFGWCSWPDAAVPAGTPAEVIDFNKQIRPILSDNCFQCHGPDEAERKAKLRLDTRQGAFAKLRNGHFAVTAGKPNESKLLERILTDDPAERMPPARTNKKLTAQQIDLLRRWIDQGATYAEHWAFVAPKRPALPQVKRHDWPKTGLDHFILARLEKAGLTPSSEADPVTLIRRLTLDLTGLPPTPAEVDGFVKDHAAQPQAALQRHVDRLLDSPHFGERMAVDWLDAARFADTHGYHIDAGRDMTRWREWVIDAFNTNMPFDQFTIEQLAGDLLPNATVSQKVASGFNRNHMINFEGGAIPEEYHNAYIVDRVNTTGTVWLGLTMTCAQCHDHKYDPISQKEYYQLYAFFHNVPESGLDGSRGNAAPNISAPTKQQKRLLTEYERQILDLERKLHAPMPQLDAAQAAWEKSALSDKAAAWIELEPKTFHSKGGATWTKQPGNAILVGGPSPATDTYTIEATTPLPRLTALRLEALPHAGFAGQGPGRSVNGNVVMTNVRLAIGGQAVKWLKASADFSQSGFPIGNAIDASPQTGWAIHPEVGKPHQAVFSFAPQVPVGTAKLTIILDFQSPHAQHQLGHFRLAVTDAADPHGNESMPGNIVAILRLPAAKRNDQQRTTLRAYYRETAAPETAGWRGELTRLRQAKADLEKNLSTAMVMQEMPNPRDTFVRIRGDYAKKGEKVQAGVPAFLPSLPRGVPANRLALARWLVSPEQPLTSRVIVNRYWQMIFGTGIVKSVEDFGSQADPPSHPELLDWLAAEFMRPSDPAHQPWDTKRFLRMLVTSATYRQASIVTKEHLGQDAENRLLARGPRLRLQAEFIRDQALAVSGLLNREIGGASVNPYQPVGLWKELSERADSGNWSAQFFVLSKGQDLYRRSMYTFWKRTSPPPQMLTFDAPDRETCTVRRGRTNTPLQALILMNDPTYVEASRKLAERLLREAKTTEERIALVFRLATARSPKERESAVLRGVLEQQLNRYRGDRAAALQLLTVGESPRDARLAVEELAAWSIVASVVLNLDETVTKN